MNNRWLILVAVTGFLPAAALNAEEPSGLQAAAAIESALESAIARSEKSVVAIARVDPDAAGGNRKVEIGQGPFGKIQQTHETPAAGDPDFVPDQFATGVVIDRRGLILTFYHVLGLKSQHFVTTSDRKTYAARIKAADPRSDLAVLEIEATNLTPITLGDATTLKKGQIVVALGNPYAIARDGSASASWGIVANLERKAPAHPDPAGGPPKDKLYQFGSLIQTDAKLNLGTSGGALVNLKGEMVGLTTSLAATAGYETAAGYAVSVDETFRRVIDRLKEGREVEYGFLGVYPMNLADYELRQGLHGARVASVEAASPAERYGLRPGDVVTHVAGRPIFDRDELFLQVGRLPVEAQVELTVLRENETQNIRVTLAKFPVRGEKVITAPQPSWRGLRVDYATALPIDVPRPATARIDPDGCVTVIEVEKDSPAAAAGLQVGMYISQVGTTPVHSPRDFQAAVAGSSGDVSLRLSTSSDGPDIRVVKAKTAERFKLGLAPSGRLTRQHSLEVIARCLSPFSTPGEGETVSCSVLNTPRRRAGSSRSRRTSRPC